MPDDQATRHVILHGEYDLARRDELRAALSLLESSGGVIDLFAVTYGDSIFIGELAALKRRLDGAPVTLAGADANMRRLLHLVGFDKLFHVVD
jgi:anti-anti-sigma regulatory factor